MTLGVLTLSHGIVDAGFYAAFTQLARLGDYSFVTEDLCNVAMYLAENPEAAERQIKTYDTERFWDAENVYMFDIGHAVSNAMTESGATKGSVSGALDDEIERLQGRIQAWDREIYGKGEDIPVKIDRELNHVSVGKYRLEADVFAGFIFYIARGGFIGWKKGGPDFARDAFNSITSSSNPVYRSLQNIAKA